MSEKISSLALIIGIKRKELHPIEVLKDDVPDADVLAVIRQCLLYDPKKRIRFIDIEKRLSNSLERCKKKETTNDTSGTCSISIGETKGKT